MQQSYEIFLYHTYFFPDFFCDATTKCPAYTDGTGSASSLRHGKKQVRHPLISQENGDADTTFYAQLPLFHLTPIAIVVFFRTFVAKILATPLPCRSAEGCLLPKGRSNIAHKKKTRREMENVYFDDAVALLNELIATPRVSREEQQASDLLEQRMALWGLNPRREANNVWATCPDYDEGKPTVLLNAHVDTVRAVASWTRQPHVPTTEGDRLYGLGANDCGGGLVTLLATYRRLLAVERAYNVVFLASAEEEVSGKDGIARVLPLLPPVSVAIVGEPTGMQPAVAERGLMVVDGYADGISGHAARGDGLNAIYEALDDLVFLRGWRFRKVSPLLGPTTMAVTVIESGTQHNVVPDRLHFVLDVRTNEYYQNEYVFSFLQKRMKKCRLEARSFRLHSSAIATDHPLVQRCVEMGMTPFGSPTLSDQALMSFPSLKLGPGESSRSHAADEYVCLSELQRAMDVYWNLLNGLGGSL